MPTVVLITGASRGLGRGLLERYLKRDDHILIAANRNPATSTSQNLADLPKGNNTKLIIVKLDSDVWSNASTAVKELERQGVEHLDVVIANAGIAACCPPVADATEQDLEAHFRSNVMGVVALYQATRELLNKSSKEPIFANVGSTAGSIISQPPIPNAVYGPSKAAAAWQIKRINAEEPRINSFSLNPGWVHTELGDAGAASFGMTEEMQKQYMIGLEESCSGMIKALDSSSKAKDGGKLVVWDGSVADLG